MSLDIYLEKRVTEDKEVFWVNITHNLGEMASAAGIYYQLWRPEELGAKKAEDLIKPLEQGLYLLKDQPENFKGLNPENGWGDYELLVEVVEKYLKACKENPEAKILISR